MDQVAQQFFEKIAPLFKGEKYPLNPPTLSPLDRFQRRLSFRNETSLYYRQCDFSGERILSVYSEDKPFTIYSPKVYISDQWDALKYGREFDFNTPFFTQFQALQLEVPKRALHLDSTMENCDFCNYGGNCKNCYLCSVPIESENCFYSRAPYKCNFDVDGMANLFNQFTYENISCVGCYEVFFAGFSENCQNSAFLLDCVSCKNCLGCIGLKHKENMYLNRPISPEELKSKLNSILQSNSELKKFKEEFEKFRLTVPFKENRNVDAENCTGNLIRNSQNCIDCYDVLNQRDSRYCQLSGEQMYDCYDCSLTGINVQNCYEQMGCFSCHNSFFGIYIHDNDSCFYISDCEHCKNCFACDGLKYKEYCILNKQYSKEEYEELVPRIIKHLTETGEWGEFFPTTLSPFAYNETVAQEIFPLSREEIEAKGWKWHEKEQPNLKSPDLIPDNINDVTDDISGKTFICETSGTPFKITSEELKFHKKYRLALPTQAPQARRDSRVKIYTPYQLFESHCAKCQKAINGIYPPQSPEIVYCEKCYMQTVY